MCLVCDDKMVQTLSRNLKMERTASAQNGSLSKVDNNVLGTSTSGSGTSENPRPELLVGNLCLVRGLCLKRKLQEHITGYDLFVDNLGKLIDPVGDVLLPLHDYGAFSQGSCTSDIVTMPSERKDKDSIGGDIARADRVDLRRLWRFSFYKNSRIT